jgi:co-chaperonin GroES (HSP10)
MTLEKRDITDSNLYNIKPMFDWVFVRLLKKSETAGGIIIPEMATDDIPRVLVLAVGTGGINDNGSIRPMRVKVDDVCIGIGVMVTILDNVHGFFRETQLLATIASKSDLDEFKVNKGE